LGVNFTKVPVMDIDESAVFSAADKAELRGVLEVKDDELGEALEGVALAALPEYRERPTST
jgi:hypothetical protein